MKKSFFNSMLIVFPLLVCSFYNCANTNDEITPVDSVFTARYDVTTLVKDKVTFGSFQYLASVQDDKMDEISGIAASRYTQGAVWIEEDSGNENKIYLIGEDGITKASYKLPHVSFLDWEDMAIAPGPQAGIPYIYVAEIGDNYRIAPFRSVYRFSEPDLRNKSFPVTDSISKIDIINFQYPDGPRDAEALMVDPLTKDMYVISKEEKTAGLYVAAYPQELNKLIKLKKLGNLPFTRIVAADISADGTEILLKDLSDIYYWKRNNTETIAQALQKPPARISYYIEPQGEAVCWKADGTGYYTISEKTGNDSPVIYFYKRN
jgi:hypothetical protein